MLALVKPNLGPGLEVVDFPDPRIKPDEVLVEVKACGICGTDMAIHQWKDWAKELVGDFVPVILGHEFGGNVVEVGKEIKNFKVGDRVVVEPFIACGTCYFCSIGSTNLCQRRKYYGVNHHGGAAQYAAVMETGIMKVPESIPYHHIPVLETVATCVRPVERTKLYPGDTVAVIGPGSIGILVMQVAKAAGATKVIMISTKRSRPRLKVARELGADLSLIAEEENLRQQVLDFTDGRGADVVFDSTGTEKGVTDALSIVRRGGQVCIIGVSDDPVRIKPFSQLMMREVNIISSLARTASSWHRTIRLVESGQVKLEPLIGDQIPLKDSLRAFDLLASREAIKIILVP